MNHTKQWVWKSSVEGKHFKHIVSISTCRCGTHGLLFFLFLYFFCFHFLVAIHRLFPPIALPFSDHLPRKISVDAPRKMPPGLARGALGAYTLFVHSGVAFVPPHAGKEDGKGEGNNDGKLRLADGKVCWDCGVKVLLLELYLNTC